MDNALHDRGTATDAAAAEPVQFGPSPFKWLVVKSEYLLQSVLKYPFAARCPHCRSPRHRLIARKYGVALVPTVVRVTGDGRVLQQTAG